MVCPAFSWPLASCDERALESQDPAFAGSPISPKCRQAQPLLSTGIEARASGSVVFALLSSRRSER